MNRTIVLLLTAMALSVGCESPSEPEPLLSETAEAYLNEVLDIMQANSINRYKIEWPVFRERTYDKAAGALTPVNTYEAIRFAVSELGDNHSFFVPPNSFSGRHAGKTRAVPGTEGRAARVVSSNPYGQRIDSTIGYLRIPNFSGSGAAATAFADAVKESIMQADTATVCGWIVDLRQNPGGNMWPMLAGVGPILGEGLAGSFIDPDNVKSDWFYRNGASFLGGAMIVQVTPPTYELVRSDPPVAVLTGPNTASSGEAIVTAFRGRPRTRSFGQGTFGVSTANGSYRLSDGALLYLTVSTFADRTGNWYGGVIQPDEEVEGEVNLDPLSDAVAQVGMTWLREQERCLDGLSLAWD